MLLGRRSSWLLSTPFHPGLGGCIQLSQAVPVGLWDLCLCLKNWTRITAGKVLRTRLRVRFRKLFFRTCSRNIVLASLSPHSGVITYLSLAGHVVLLHGQSADPQKSQEPRKKGKENSQRGSPTTMCFARRGLSFTEHLGTACESRMVRFTQAGHTPSQVCTLEIEVWYQQDTERGDTAL